MFSGNIPFHDLTNDYRIMMAVTFEGRRPPRPSHNLANVRGLKDPIWSIIEECWDSDPKLRPSSDRIVQRLQSQFHFLEDDRAWDDFDHSFASRALRLAAADHPYTSWPCYKDRDLTEFVIHS